MGDAERIAAARGSVAKELGGAAMVDATQDADRVDINPDHAVGIVIGKRYINEDESLEVLCVKAGDGSLAVNGDLLLQKDTKALPKTD